MKTNPSTAKRALDRILVVLGHYPVLFTAVFLATAGNLAFWQRFPDLITGSIAQRVAFTLSFALLMVLLTSLLLQLFRFRFVLKPVLVLVLIGSAFASYFMMTYGVVIDTTMIYNVAETDMAETAELLSLGLFMHVLLFGVLPALLVVKLKIRYATPLKQLLKNTGLVFLCLGAIAGNVLLFSQDYASFFRNHHHARYFVNPINYIYSIGKYASLELENHDVSPVAVGLDAHQVKTATSQGKQELVVIVVGETARAMNFSLNGYARDTNPVLAHEDVINFPEFYSCGTSTHISLPCMFSRFNQGEFDEAAAKRYEKLPDVLRHAGLRVLWRDNNTGCKGVCKNIPTEDVTHLHVDEVCNDAECYDEALLLNLKQVIEQQQRDMVVILHQNGSHGPAYYRRHPDSFKRFVPECTSNELRECTHQEIVNAYDNTIAYTDYFIGQVISLLKDESDRFDTAMLYVSDHGESLGEHNVYLHSLPYMIAPEEQKHVPFVAWFSDGFLKDNQLDGMCLRQRASRRYTHDYLFHSVLGLTHVHSEVYDPQLDIFAPCQGVTREATSRHRQASEGAQRDHG